MNGPKKPDGPNPTWRFADARSLLLANVGGRFGARPEERLDEIRAERAHFGHRIRAALAIEKHHVVADIGSGCGLVAHAIAPAVQRMHCVDISEDFLAFCKQQLSEFDNVRYSLIDYATFPDIADAELHSAYSSNVFIHFNYYDFVHYLREVHRVLRSGGKFFFDFLNADRLDVAEDGAFKQMLAGYPHSRKEWIFNLMHPFSERALGHLLPQLGFRLLNVSYTPEGAGTCAVIAKIDLPGAH